MGIRVIIIRVMLCFVANGYGPAIVSILHLNPIPTFFVWNKDSLNCIRRTNKCHIIRLVRIRLPLCAVCTAHTFFVGHYISLFDYDTTIFWQWQFLCQEKSVEVWKTKRRTSPMGKSCVLEYAPQPIDEAV